MSRLRDYKPSAPAADASKFRWDRFILALNEYERTVHKPARRCRNNNCTGTQDGVYFDIGTVSK